MQIHVYQNEAEIARAAAALFASLIIKKPDAVIGLATGSTPISTYQELIRLYKDKVVDYARVTSFNLDEYVGLPPTHTQSYRAFMQEQLFDHINIQDTHVPSGIAKDLAAECKRYDQAIVDRGGIDLQLLGIGHNGHIGFNEPNDVFVYNTNVVDLTESTIQANKRNFDSEDQVPRTAVSMGIGSIMQARAIVLIALGKGKAEAIKRTIKGEIDPQMPASILRCHHNVTVLLDKEAASLL